MSLRDLPAHPNLEQYRKQAKEFVRAARAGDTRAFAVMREHHPRFKYASDDELRRTRFALADAQLIVARRHGFESWPKFAKHIETITSESSSRIWTSAEKALVGGDIKKLDALLARHGDMLRKGPVQSSWWGGLAPNYSKGDARAIIAREHDFESWDQFASFAEAMKDPRSPVAQFEAAVDAIIIGDIATLEGLLRANPSLVGARSTRKHHSTLLHYVGSNGVEGFRQRTPKNIVKVAEVLLDAGADIDATADMYGGGSDTLGLAATSIHPVTAGVQEELMVFLLARGASLGGQKGAAAWSKLINACHANGRPGAAEFLARRADALDLEAAAGVGRLDIVKTFFDTNGRLTPNATDKQMQDGFTWACEYGRTNVVEFLLQRGMDVAAKLRHHRQTGLHWAAYGGYADTVRVLLRHNAPVNVKDETFETTPLRWALYAWAGGGPHAGDSQYYDVVKLLVAAGATVATEWLNEDEREDPIGKRIREDTAMRAALGAKLGSTAGIFRSQDDRSET
jgi:ankyrin repeat protein